MWIGIFRRQDPPRLPPTLRPVLPRWVTVALVRYLEGPLIYDELAIGALARHGHQIGIFVEHIWVDSESSVAGGRRIWGVPKEMATFRWDGNLVSIEDADGAVATLAVDQSPVKRPRIPFIAPGFGLRNGQLVYSKGVVRARLRGSSMHVRHWSRRFEAIGKEPRVGFDAAPFKMSLPEPVVLVA